MMETEFVRCAAELILYTGRILYDWKHSGVSSPNKENNISNLMIAIPKCLTYIEIYNYVSNTTKLYYV